MKCKMFDISSNYCTDNVINEWLEEVGPITIEYVTSRGQYDAFVIIFYKEKEEDV